MRTGRWIQGFSTVLYLMYRWSHTLTMLHALGKLNRLRICLLYQTAQHHSLLKIGSYCKYCSRFVERIIKAPLDARDNVLFSSPTNQETVFVGSCQTRAFFDIFPFSRPRTTAVTVTTHTMIVTQRVWFSYVYPTKLSQSTVNSFLKNDLYSASTGVVQDIYLSKRGGGKKLVHREYIVGGPWIRDSGLHICL
jgi:hypothetical protein